MKPKAAAGPAMGPGATRGTRNRCPGHHGLLKNDQERFRGRTTDQVKQACDPQRQTPEECSRTLDR
jgi:hypothetical protein